MSIKKLKRRGMSNKRGGQKPTGLINRLVLNKKPKRISIHTLMQTISHNKMIKDEEQ